MTMNKLMLSWADVEAGVQRIIREMYLDGFEPDIVLGVDRGGLPISVLMSHYLKVPHQSVKVSLRDNPDTESLLWAPDDVIQGAQILIVDDINDSGATQSWLKDDWASSVAGVCPDFVDKYWHKSIKWASLVDNEGSWEYSDYSGITINKHENDVWVDFPWESWWERKT